MEGLISTMESKMVFVCTKSCHRYYGRERKGAETWNRRVSAVTILRRTYAEYRVPVTQIHGRIIRYRAGAGDSFVRSFGDGFTLAS